nr:coatomer subunit alpha-1 [Tanacetum cinerariifolium]
MATHGRKNAITEPAVPPARDPHDDDGSEDVNPFGGRNHLLTKETESEPIILDIGDKEEELARVSFNDAPSTIFWTDYVAARWAKDRVVIFDLQQRLVLGSLQTPFVKYIFWSNDMETMALLSKHAIVIASKKLNHRCTLHETICVKEMDERGNKADWGEEMDLDNVNGFENQDTQEIQEEYEAESSLMVLGRRVSFRLKEKNELISDEDYYELDRKEPEDHDGIDENTNHENFCYDNLQIRCNSLHDVHTSAYHRS